MRGLAVFLVVMMMTPALVTAEQEWPGEPVDNHVHMTWAALTMEVGDWSKENPEIVNLLDVGKSELGKSLWVVQLSDWSMETKPDGSPKEIIYIDGGHHGNEYLGTALAWLSAKWYINGWNEGNDEAIRVLQQSEIHILIMLNPDGNDIDTRWNINQVDLNRNYDHYWNTCPTTQPGSSAFSEDETHANSIEGFGIAYIEAAQYGIPSIASNVGGTPEAVLHNKTGLIINNFNELDESIKNLVENKQNRIELGQNAKNRAENELNWEKQVSKYNKLIVDIQ